MIFKIKDLVYFSLFVVFLTACQSEKTFKVNGSVTNADGKVLYLEAVDIDKIILLDSVKLKKTGNFEFKELTPENPEFYRLRLNNKIINFSIDSTETIQITTSFDQFSTNYIVEGSENSKKIQELVLLQNNLQYKIDSLSQAVRNRKITNRSANDSLQKLVNEYKEYVKMNYIYPYPNKSFSYFALFQKVNNYLIFDPLGNKEDIKAFGAVATSLYQAYPHADRSKNLYNMVIKGMKNTRAPRQEEIEIDLPEVEQTGLIDIDLKDIKGVSYKLSDLKGKVILLDFTIYQNPVSITHNFNLRELYDKYHSSGLEIYQISLDSDEHFWKTTAGNLPWICVRDPNSIYSTIANTYYIEQVPTFFLINRNNELNSRHENIEDIQSLEKEIKSLL